MNLICLTVKSTFKVPNIYEKEEEEEVRKRCETII